MTAWESDHRVGDIIYELYLDDYEYSKFVDAFFDEDVDKDLSPPSIEIEDSVRDIKND